MFVKGIKMFSYYDVVEFEDGTFAVRKTTLGIFKSYISLSTYKSWRKMSDVNDFCKTSNKNMAIRIKNKMTLNIKRVVCD